MENRYSAKKPTLFLELHNFSFRHDPVRANMDFIGRKAIRSRLRAILNHSKALSGAYLITGSRGVGKTSFVNKVLSELSHKNELAAGLIRFATLFFYVLITTVFLKLFNLYSDENKVIVVVATLSIVLPSLPYLCYFSSYRKKHISWRHCFTILLRELILWNKKPNRAGRFYQFVKITACTAIIQLIYIIASWNGSLSNFFSPPGICLLFGACFWIMHIIRNVHDAFSKSDLYDSTQYREIIQWKKTTSYIVAGCLTLIIMSIIGLIWTALVLYQKCPSSDTSVTGLKWMQEPSLWLFLLFLLLGLVAAGGLIWKVYTLHISTASKQTPATKNFFHLCNRLISHKLQQAISLKNWINRPRQVFVKINLGYEELKSIDVLRLISHNITIEYRKYIYSGSFYWIRTGIITLVCLGCTLFFHQFVKYDFTTLFKHVPMYPTLQEILKSLYVFSHNIYDQVYIGLRYVWTFFIGLFDNHWGDYQQWNGFYPFPAFSFEQFLFFLLLVFLYKMTAHLPILKLHIRAPFINLRHLMWLQESIAANIRTEEGIKAENKLINFLKLGYSRKIEKDCPMLDAHDIEKQLIDIMTDISEGWLFQSPQFIIIFDELDKIESEDSKKERMSKTDSFSPDTIRLRQEAVFGLLSGLKYILSTMPAKFIFVAGREMYEASLADASDRSHYLSSIFDDVINVPSFMSDFSDDKSYDICSMTEQYVCRYLFPNGYIVKEYSLKEYGRYLKDKDKNENKKAKKKSDGEKISEEQVKNPEELEQEREEILMHLHNFILYLTYAGKGAPKKIISLMDKFVVKLQPYHIREMLLKAEEEGVTISPLIRQYYPNSTYFLKLDFYGQYTVGLMSRMIMPVMYRFSHRNIHQYGDKLLVSTLFFMDHLYKFHSYSFSWRALTSSPELIDVNKTPELRNHIADILHFLTQNDLKTISNGLYDFRFFKVIAQEINFMTRVSETSSATFDFSLDESFSVKQYYERRLANQRKIYEADRIETKNTIFELADQHFTLGELSLYDEDLDNAIVEFDAAISIIQTLEPDKMKAETILALIKNMLSLGIAYEKQSLNDQAFLVYSEVVKLIVASRNTDIQSLGLETYESPSDGKMKVRAALRWPSPCSEPHIYVANETMKNPAENSLMELLDRMPHLHPAIHQVISKITTYDGLQLFYLPLLAKFQILEKSQIGGIQKEDIRRLLKEFYFLVNMVNKENKSLICASFYLKLGNILYYKNAHLLHEMSSMDKIWPFSVNRECFDLSCIFKKECKGSPRTHFWGMEIKQDALYFYIHSLFLIIEKTDYEVCYHMQHFIQKIQTLKKDNFKGWDDMRFNMVGKVLAGIGDAFLADLPSPAADKDQERKALKDFMEKYFAEKKKNSATSTPQLLNILTGKMQDKIVKIAALYLLAAWFYKKATAYNLAGHLYMRLLTLLKYNASKGYPLVEEGKELLKRAIRNTSSAFKDICFEHQQDINDILKATRDTLPDPDKHSLLYTETFESILAYKGIQLASIQAKDATEYAVKIEELYKKIFHTVRYDIYNNIYNRIKLLKFKSEMNYRWLRALLCKNEIIESAQFIADEESFYQSGLKELSAICYMKIEKAKLDNIQQNEKDKEQIAFLVRDSLFNLTEILRFVQLYGETFLLTNLFVADTYDKITCWLQLKEWMDTSGLSDEKSEKELRKLIGERYYQKHQECWNWANALRFYYKAEETHHEGRSYKDMVNRACFLNDEFSDQRLHFITAQERKKVGEENFKQKVRSIENAKATAYYESFV